jgi:tRNA isopentenyl-2-thiomethyl-A-37 hydroxylase MiaE
VGKVVHHFQKLDEAAGYKDVEILQVELDRFTDGLPPHFRMYEPDKGLDESECGADVSAVVKTAWR